MGIPYLQILGQLSCTMNYQLGRPLDNESDIIWYLKRVCPQNMLLENPIDVILLHFRDQPFSLRLEGNNWKSDG